MSNFEHRVDLATQPLIESTIHYDQLDIGDYSAEQLLSAAMEEQDRAMALRFAAAALHRSRADYFVGARAATQPVITNFRAEHAVELILDIGKDLGFAPHYLDRWRNYAKQQHYQIVEINPRP